MLFDQYFEVVLADTMEGKEIHYAVRYQVYCDEMGFENKHDYPRFQEYDHWDSTAVHFVVRYKATGEWVAALRLVFPDNGSLPAEQFYLLDTIDELDNKEGFVELSRLCVVKEFRRKLLFPGMKNKDESVNFKHLNSSIIFGLLNAAVVYSQKSDINAWVCVGTKALARIINKKGLGMLRIGDACFLNGERYLFIMNLDGVLDNPLWERYSMGYKLYSDI